MRTLLRTQYSVCKNLRMTAQTYTPRPFVEARTRLGWSQQELADRCGVSRRTVQNVESGRSKPHIDQLLVLAGSLGLGVESVFPHVPEPAMDSTGRGKTPDDAATAKPRAVGTHQGA